MMDCKDNEVMDREEREYLDDICWLAENLNMVRMSYKAAMREFTGNGGFDKYAAWKLGCSQRKAVELLNSMAKFLYDNGFVVDGNFVDTNSCGVTIVDKCRDLSGYICKDCECTEEQAHKVVILFLSKKDITEFLDDTVKVYYERK